MQRILSLPGLACLSLLAASILLADEAEIHNDRGMAWSDQREHDKAIAEFTLAIQIDAAFASAYNNRGLAWEEKKEYDKALADFTRAIELRPTSISYNNRGTLWLDQEHFDQALADFDRSLELDP